MWYVGVPFCPRAPGFGPKGGGNMSGISVGTKGAASTAKPPPIGPVGWPNLLRETHP